MLKPLLIDEKQQLPYFINAFGQFQTDRGYTRAVGFNKTHKIDVRVVRDLQRLRNLDININDQCKRLHLSRILNYIIDLKNLTKQRILSHLFFIIVHYYVDKSGQTTFIIHLRAVYIRL